MENCAKFSVVILPYKKENVDDWIYQPSFDPKAHFLTFIKGSLHELGVMFQEQLV